VTDGYHVVEVPNEDLAASLASQLAAVRPNDDFVIIGGPEGLFTSDDRVRGFQRGLAEAGRPPAEILRSSFNRAGGYEAGLTLAARIKASRSVSKGDEGTRNHGSVPPLCIFAVNDVMAIGAAAALRSEGLRIPRDATIAGFDDIETLRDFRPALSTVRLPLEDIGRIATRSAAGSAAADDAAAPSPVTGQVTLRRSTEPAS
jgi:LacI family transcriptional regulator